jgi:hypothetical protein
VGDEGDIVAVIDQTKGWRAIDARLAKTTDSRHRLLLENLRDHLEAETTGDFERLLGTLAAHPDYHFWIDGNGFGGGPKGIAAVTAHYQRLYEERRHVLEYDIDRIVVDDDTIVTEGWFRQIYPGWVLRNRGAEVDDPDAAYLVTVRIVLFWPYDADGKLVGEDSYANGDMFAPERIRKLEPDEIPEAWFAAVP